MSLIKLKVCGCGLIIFGALLEMYNHLIFTNVNTNFLYLKMTLHWLCAFYEITGLADISCWLLCRTRPISSRSFFLNTAIVFNILTACISTSLACALLLVTIVVGQQPIVGICLSMIEVAAHLLILALSIIVLRVLLASVVSLQKENQEKNTYGKFGLLGIFLGIIAVGHFGNFFAQKIIIHVFAANNDEMFLFQAEVMYHIEDMVWILVYIINSFILMASEWPKVTNAMPELVFYLGLVFSALSFYPCTMQFYDIYFLLTIQDVSSDTQLLAKTCLIIRGALTIAHFVVLLFTCKRYLQTIVQEKMCFDSSNIIWSSTISIVWRKLGIFSIITGMVLLTPCLVTVAHNLPTYSFHTITRDLPVVLMIFGVLCYWVCEQTNNAGPYILPCIMASCVILIKSSILYVAHTLSLFYEQYVEKEMCRLLSQHPMCPFDIGYLEVLFHFIETVIAIFMIPLMVTVMKVVKRLCGSFKIDLQDQLQGNDIMLSMIHTKTQRLQRNCRILLFIYFGFTSSLLLLFVIFCTMTYDRYLHIDLTIEGWYQFSDLISKIIIFVIQYFLINDDILHTPLNCMTCMFLSIMNILTTFSSASNARDHIIFSMLRMVDIECALMQFGLLIFCGLIWGLSRGRITEKEQIVEPSALRKAGLKKFCKIFKLLKKTKRITCAAG
uniref:Uncharacterized protein n=1 Tax=Romanomermis culicivorax TaxID=13658 RepID=A0A915IIT8_ROMCU